MIFVPTIYYKIKKRSMEFPYMQCLQFKETQYIYFFIIIVIEMKCHRIVNNVEISLY